MSAVQLRIVHPPDGAVFIGVTQVPLIGEVVELPDALTGVNLYYRWYSNLFPSKENRYSIHEVALTDATTPYNAPLGVGTHVITLAASDQEKETQEAQNATQHGGITGGATGDSKCIIHVYKAILKKAASNNADGQLDKRGSVLEAIAPMKWDDPDYQHINRIRYRWQFEPLGLPAGRHSADLIPHVEELTFDPSGPLVRYQGPLPEELDTGDYTLTLRVEDIEDDTIRDEDSKPVNIQTPVV
ncbi:hypothetical protein HYR99_35540 [Candidatus Poribacteria bacterium]|nr:hypothetical protein [Candidatus Poribacteria bacterium]